MMTLWLVYPAFSGYTGYRVKIKQLLLTFLAFPCILKRRGSPLVSGAAIGPFEDTALRNIEVNP